MVLLKGNASGCKLVRCPILVGGDFILSELKYNRNNRVLPAIALVQTSDLFEYLLVFIRNLARHYWCSWIEFMTVAFNWLVKLLEGFRLHEDYGYNSRLDNKKIWRRCWLRPWLWISLKMNARAAKLRRMIALRCKDSVRLMSHCSVQQNLGMTQRRLTEALCTLITRRAASHHVMLKQMGLSEDKEKEMFRGIYTVHRSIS